MSNFHLLCVHFFFFFFFFFFLFCFFIIMNLIMRKFDVVLKLLCMKSPVRISYVVLLIKILFCVLFFSLCIL